MYLAFHVPPSPKLRRDWQHLSNLTQISPNKKSESDDPQATAVALVSLAPCFALAQDEQSSSADPTEIEEVVVTGSRIVQDSYDANASVIALDADSLNPSGLTSLSDMLGRLTVFGSTHNMRFNNSDNFGLLADGDGIAAGAANVDLHHLGAKTSVGPSRWCQVDPWIFRQRHLWSDGPQYDPALDHRPSRFASRRRIRNPWL